nr:hypothetical protein [uncultured Chryseobacterium sp.]
MDIPVSKMIKQRINDQTLQEDDQCGFEKKGFFRGFMPVGNHSEDCAGGSAKESQKKEYRFRNPPLMLFSPAFVEAECKEGNQRGENEKILHEGQR